MIKLLFTAVVVLCACDAYKILLVFPFPGKSHRILGDGFVRHLLNAGHEVTYISGYPRSNPHVNLTHVHAVSNAKMFNENTINIQAIMDKQVNMQDHEFIQQIMLTISTSTIRDDNVQRLLWDTTKTFDLVIGEWMFSQLYSTFAAVFECPFIWSSSMEPHWQVTRLIDQTLNPAYNSDMMVTPFSPPFTFIQRVRELWVQIQGVLRYRRFENIEKGVYETNIVPILKERGIVVSSYEDLMYNASLMFGNSHVSLGQAQRLPQSYKPIGGYHIDSKPSPLSADLQKIMDDSKHGVIFFSLGSNLKSKDIPKSLKQGFLKIFKDLKQTVLWKFEEVLPNLPKNVHIYTWAPQQSILAHVSCILFITHGGLLSITEAVHYGKPFIGIPVFADQFTNVQRAVDKGYARKVELSHTMDVGLKAEINEIIGNPIYAQRAKEWSFVYHNRPVTPGQELVHWSEHVIKTGGALHLRSIALLVPWYQKMYLDLLGIVIVAVLVVFFALRKILRRVTTGQKKSKKKTF